jgi:hypothetical protein
LDANGQQAAGRSVCFTKKLVGDEPLCDVSQGYYSGEQPARRHILRAGPQSQQIRQNQNEAARHRIPVRHAFDSET